MATTDLDGWVLAIYDVCGIQEFIFASSRLRENAGASRIVTRATQELLPEALDAELGKGRWGEPKGDFRMAQDAELAAEAIYIGGGNAVVAFRDRADYDRVSRTYARSLLRLTDAMTLATACVPITKDYAKDRTKLDRALQKSKRAMRRDRPMGALPIVERTQDGHLPVAAVYREQPTSTLQALKRAAAQKIGADDDEAIEMEDLAEQRGEDAYVAVVHIDGNGMGQYIQNQMQSRSNYGDAVPVMRKISQEIAKLYGDISQCLISGARAYAQDADRAAGVTIHGRDKDGARDETNGRKILPIRRIIQDGDDVTFIANARWGVPLAARFLRRLLNEHKELSACAGVALVHSHFPFDLAYQAAESLCSAAKKKRTQKDQAQGQKQMPSRDSYLAFRLVRDAFGDQGEEQPDRLLKIEREGGDLEELEDLIRQFTGAGDSAHAWPRSRLKSLYEVLRAEELKAPRGALPSQDGDLFATWKRESASRGYKLESVNWKLLPLALELLDCYDVSERFAVAFDGAEGGKKP